MPKIWFKFKYSSLKRQIFRPKWWYFLKSSKYECKASLIKPIHTSLETHEYDLSCFLLNLFSSCTKIVQKMYKNWILSEISGDAQIVDKLTRRPKKSILSDLKVKITETTYSCAMNPGDDLFSSKISYQNFI